MHLTAGKIFVGTSMHRKVTKAQPFSLTWHQPALEDSDEDVESQDQRQPRADELSEAAAADEVNGGSGAAEVPHATPGGALPVAASAAEPSSPGRIDGASDVSDDVGLPPAEGASPPLAVPAEADDAGTEEGGNTSGDDTGGRSLQPLEAGNGQEEDHDRSDSQQLPQDREEDALIGSGSGPTEAAQEGGAVEGAFSTSVARDEEGSEPGDDNYDEGLGEQQGQGEGEGEVDSSSLAGEEQSSDEERGAALPTVPLASSLGLDAEDSETDDAGAAATQHDKSAEDGAESAEAGSEGEALVAEDEAPGSSVEEVGDAGGGGVDAGGLAESDEEGEQDGDGGVIAGEGEVGDEDNDGTDGGAAEDAESLGSATPDAAPVVASGAADTETEGPAVEEQTAVAAAAAAREREDALTARLLVAEELLVERERQLESTNLAMAEIMQNGKAGSSSGGGSDGSGSAAAVAEARAGGERALADLRGQHAREVSRLEGLVEAEKRKGKAAADAVRSWETKAEEFQEKDKMLKVLYSSCCRAHLCLTGSG